MSVSHRIHAIRVATKREIRSTLHGIGLYVVLSLVFLVAVRKGFKGLLG